MSARNQGARATEKWSSHEHSNEAAQPAAVQLVEHFGSVDLAKQALDQVGESQPASPPLKGSKNGLELKRCLPCEGGVPALSHTRIHELLRDIPDWGLEGTHKIRRAWKMKDFQSCLNFLNLVGQLAESENHHPDLHLTDYKRLAIELSTHAVKGLTENDFILAAKIDRLPGARS